MRRVLFIAMVVLALAAGSPAQAANSSATSPSASQAQADQQGSSTASHDTNDGNASSKDGQAANDQNGKKASTIIGCLAGPDVDGHFELRSMQHRTGVDVIGPDELAYVTGNKVKLSGQWVAVANVHTDKGEKQVQRFEVTSYDVMTEKCTPPAVTTPISKQKQQQQKAAARQKAENNPQ
ncbi:MAG TPA: hypothetical protein VMT34_01155 [Aggregatilineales bacterium]|nr:hypothetical protein [Aggregatilineales bacterium]